MMDSEAVRIETRLFRTDKRVIAVKNQPLLIHPDKSY